MPRKPRSDSVAGRIAAAQSGVITHGVPDGLDKLTQPEGAAWQRYISARSGWKAAQLAGLHRLVKLESRIRTLEQEAEATGAVYEKASGDLAPHPIHAELRSGYKLLHSELRLLGLQVTLDTARTDARHGALAGSATPVAASTPSAAIDWSLVDK